MAAMGQQEMKRTNNSAKSLRPALASIPASCSYLGGLSRAKFYADILPGLETVHLGTRHFVVVASLDRFIARQRRTKGTKKMYNSAPIAVRDAIVRVVVGFNTIALIAEKLPDRAWYILDYYPLHCEADDWLASIRRGPLTGYSGRRYRVHGDLLPAVFSPRGANDHEAREAMERLRRQGLAVSNDITSITDREFLEFVDGKQRRRRSHR
jgi:hypothetical protein